MNPSEVLAILRRALDLSEEQVLEMAAKPDQPLDAMQIQALSGLQPCPPQLLGQFLDGLIVARRGPPREGTPAHAPEAELTNNIIFKKLRIALSLQEDQVIDLLHHGDLPVGRRQLRTLFRKPGHRHYRECHDETLAAFLRGLEKARG